MSDINALGVEYAEKIIQECKKRDIEVFLIYTPTPASENRQQEANRAMQIAQKYDIGYIF